MDIAHVMKPDDKFIAAQSTDKIFIPYAFPETFGHFLQQPVADCISAKIVDGLEAV